ncbi:hypothetical protein DFA_02689 [Cavenderia fasciculata]|uniref:Uncharacterized protein n=1 Tax=Cavenderia fasciculata TaxID=261658 RepID=F4Q035_CACFS|nr:uncharacterized protein DFA_02689 [Cavenderia fasciculata]EGG18949.1 hypothetical protein DFA_02689 [Cavenderia fasciculata]|eukprot:XP_004357411.1 hypothetical protein DFA_02689 [Cavenderia fasciculata]
MRKSLGAFEKISPSNTSKCEECIQEPRRKEVIEIVQSLKKSGVILNSQPNIDNIIVPRIKESTIKSTTIAIIDTRPPEVDIILKNEKNQPCTHSMTCSEIHKLNNGTTNCICAIFHSPTAKDAISNGLKGLISSKIIIMDDQQFQQGVDSLRGLKLDEIAANWEIQVKCSCGESFTLYYCNFRIFEKLKKLFDGCKCRQDTTSSPSWRNTFLDNIKFLQSIGVESNVVEIENRLKKSKSQFEFNSLEPSINIKYKNISNYIGNSELYTEKRFTKFLNGLHQWLDCMEKGKDNQTIRKTKELIEMGVVSSSCLNQVINDSSKKKITLILDACLREITMVLGKQPINEVILKLVCDECSPSDLVLNGFQNYIRTKKGISTNEIQAIERIVKSNHPFEELILIDGRTIYGKTFANNH